jgi:hypothetical protein
MSSKSNLSNAGALAAIAALLYQVFSVNTVEAPPPPPPPVAIVQQQAAPIKKATNPLLEQMRNTYTKNGNTASSACDRIADKFSSISSFSSPLKGVAGMGGKVSQPEAPLTDELLAFLQSRYQS